MKKILLVFILFFSINAQSQTSEMDAFWEEASRTVTEGDFEGYSATFHEEAILVNGMGPNSYPISLALSGWKQGFDNTKAGTMKASVEFRFSERIHGESSAHETGIFNYSWQNEGEEIQSVLIHFQALLTKVEGEWKMLMEYQISIATEEEWEALK